MSHQYLSWEGGSLTAGIQEATLVQGRVCHQRSHQTSGHKDLWLSPSAFRTEFQKEPLENYQSPGDNGRGVGKPVFGFRPKENESVSINGSQVAAEARNPVRCQRARSSPGVTGTPVLAHPSAGWEGKGSETTGRQHLASSTPGEAHGEGEFELLSVAWASEFYWSWIPEGHSSQCGAKPSGVCVGGTFPGSWGRCHEIVLDRLRHDCVDPGHSLCLAENVGCCCCIVRPEELGLEPTSGSVTTGCVT